jgi:hypothetical protein
MAASVAQTGHPGASAFLSLTGDKQTYRGHDEIDAFDPARPFASPHDSGGSIPATGRHAHPLSGCIQPMRATINVVRERLPLHGNHRMAPSDDRRLVSSVPKSRRQERNFWMQRREAKKPPERPLWSAETGNVENGRQDPRRNGPFSIDDGFRGSGRLDGGVCSQIRTGLDPELPDNWLFAGNFRQMLPVIGKRARIRCVNSMICERIP